MNYRSADWKQSAWRVLAIVAAAVGMSWPALVSGSPIWIPDSIVYFRGQHSFSKDLAWNAENLRSVVYSFGIYLLHWNVSAWPVVALNALLTAWTIWLVVRALAKRRTVAVYLGLVAALCGLSTVAWYVSSLMPDILGAVLYLCLYLMVFAWETLRRWERAAVLAVAFWTLTSHPTYPVLAAGLLGFLGLLALVRWAPMQGRGLALAKAAAVLALAMAVQVGVNKLVFGKASVMGANPPRLTARLIADGPAREYLRANCGHLDWTLCKSLDRLPYFEDFFLWAPDGIYQTATPEERKRLAEEEMPLLKATVRAYPWRQAKRSCRNFWAELTIFGIEGKEYHNEWMEANLDGTIPGARERWLRAEEVLNAMPRRAMRRVQEVGLPVSAVLLAAMLPWAWRRRQEKLLGLAVVVVFVVVANAFVTGVYAGMSTRYGGRIVWLMPMVAGLFLWGWWEGRTRE